MDGLHVKVLRPFWSSQKTGEHFLDTSAHCIGHAEVVYPNRHDRREITGTRTHTKASRTLQRLSEYVELPPVKSRSCRETEGWSHSPPKSKLEASHGSVGAAFKLCLAGPPLGHGNNLVSTAEKPRNRALQSRFPCSDVLYVSMQERAKIQLQSNNTVSISY